MTKPSNENTIGARRISELEMGQAGDNSDVAITEDRWSIEASQAGNISLKTTPWSIETSRAGNIPLKSAPWSIETSEAGNIPLNEGSIPVRQTAAAKAIRAALRGEKDWTEQQGQGTADRGRG